MTKSGNSSWKVTYKKSVRKDLKKISPDILKIIQQIIEEKLMVDPLLYGKPLRKTLKGLFKLRVGDYRIVYSIKKKVVTVTVITIAHRRDVYKNLK